MGKETERKFLIIHELWPKDTPRKLIRQGYLLIQKDKTIRVRISGDEAFLTIKGATEGISRDELEYKIPPEDAIFLLDKYCEKPLVEKYRHRAEYKGHWWEIDVFLGENEGLILAEIELGSENEDFDKPEWVGREVTYELRYYNSQLVSNPFRNW